jgi:hypothetical protein
MVGMVLDVRIGMVVGLKRYPECRLNLWLVLA